MPSFGYVAPNPNQGQVNYANAQAQGSDGPFSSLGDFFSGLAQYALPVWAGPALGMFGAEGGFGSLGGDAAAADGVPAGGGLGGGGLSGGTIAAGGAGDVLGSAAGAGGAAGASAGIGSSVLEGAADPAFSSFGSPELGDPFGGSSFTPAQASYDPSFSNTGPSTFDDIQSGDQGALDKPKTFWETLQGVKGGTSSWGDLLKSGGQSLLGGGAKPGSMPWGSLGNLWSMGTGAYGLYQGAQLNKEAKAMQDPYAAQRGQYANQLSALNANPGAVLPTLPGYQAGLSAIERSMAANGYLGSGNMMAALQQYGGNAFQQESSRLAGLSGENVPPQAYQQAQLAAKGGALNLDLNALGVIGKGIAAA